MMASELIEKLLEIIDKCGDAEIRVFPTTSSPTTIKHVEHVKMANGDKWIRMRDW